MDISNGGSSYGSYARYGATPNGRTGGSSYADADVSGWAKALADAMLTCNEVTQSYGWWLSQNNKESSRLVKKTRENTELRAAIGDFLEIFPIPTGKENHNPTLKQVEEILAQRSKDYEGMEYTPGAVYDKGKLTELNNMLKSGGLVPLTENSTKGAFETMRTRIDGVRDEVSGLQTLAQTKTGMVAGAINQFQTQVQGFIKTILEIGKGFARLPGSV